MQWLAELHGRLQGQCDALMRLQERLAGGGGSTAVHAAAGSVRRSFDRIAGPLHQVEEQDLFPALLESMTTEVPLDGAIEAAQRLMAGDVRGRIVVRTA